MGSGSETKEKVEARKENEEEEEHDEHPMEPDGELPRAECSAAQSSAGQAGKEDWLQLQEAGTQAPGRDGGHQRAVRGGSQHDCFKITPSYSLLSQAPLLPSTPVLLSPLSTCLQGGLRGGFHSNLPHPSASISGTRNTTWTSAFWTQSLQHNHHQQHSTIRLGERQLFLDVHIKCDQHRQQQYQLNLAHIHLQQRNSSYSTFIRDWDQSDRADWTLWSWGSCDRSIHGVPLPCFPCLPLPDSWHILNSSHDIYYPWRPVIR